MNLKAMKAILRNFGLAGMKSAIHDYLRSLVVVQQADLGKFVREAGEISNSCWSSSSSFSLR